MKERRKKVIPVSHERRGRPTGFPEGMRSPITAEVDYTDEEREFMVAIENYKRERKRPFPTWREVLAVAKSLGYRLVARNTFQELLNGTAEPGRADAG